MVKEQLEECREDISGLQAERDEIDVKIFDSDQVQEILEDFPEPRKFLHRIWLGIEGVK